MMKSVALLDSVPQDEDFVVVGNLSDFDTNNDDASCFCDNDSYDYCDDLSLSSNHQTITSTSNPLQVVRENFFAECPAPCPSTIMNSLNSLGSCSVEEDEDETDVKISGFDNDGMGLINQDTIQPKGFQSMACFCPATKNEVAFLLSTTSRVSKAAEIERTLQVATAAIHKEDRMGAFPGNCPTDQGEVRLPDNSSLSQDMSSLLIDNPIVANQERLSDSASEEAKSNDATDRDGDGDENLQASSLTSRHSCETLEPPPTFRGSGAASERLRETEDWSSSAEADITGKNVRHLNKTERRKQLKIAKKAAAAAIALSQLTLRSSFTSSLLGTHTNPGVSPKRKSRSSRIRVANIAVIAEVLKSFRQQDSRKQVSRPLNKFL